MVKIPKPRKPEKKKKPESKASRKKLVAELDKLWAQAVARLWGGLCAMCGRAGTQSHHFFGKKSCPSVRWDIDNGLLLCFTCHIRKVHQQGCTEPARDALIRKIGNDKFDRLKQDAFRPRKVTTQLLEETMQRLLTQQPPE